MRICEKMKNSIIRVNLGSKMDLIRKICMDELELKNQLNFKKLGE
jgi:hypothetical protein